MVKSDWARLCAESTSCGFSRSASRLAIARCCHLRAEGGQGAGGRDLAVTLSTHSIMVPPHHKWVLAC